MAKRRRITEEIAARMDPSWHAFPGGWSTWKLFCRRIEGTRLIVTLGVEYSMLYKGSFTGSFYMSLHAGYALVSGDFPKDALARITQFLTDQERADLFAGADGKVRDRWWDSSDTAAAEGFVRAVNLAWPRFTRNEDLQARVLASPSSELWLRENEAILELAGPNADMDQLIDAVAQLHDGLKPRKLKAYAAEALRLRTMLAG